MDTEPQKSPGLKPSTPSFFARADSLAKSALVSVGFKQFETKDDAIPETDMTSDMGAGLNSAESFDGDCDYEDGGNLVSPERRAQIWKVLKKAIRDIAKQKRERIVKDAKYAKLCILDAFQGRLKNGLASNSKKSWWIYTIFSIQTSSLLLKLVIYACAFHTFSIFFEPENSCSASTFYYLLQLAVILIYSFDIALKMSYEGLKVSQWYEGILPYLSMMIL